ncbi:MAG TPA: hypothetical protein VKD89_05680 [Candidatus Udaeobacter sp.]|nr:hypothetical protein [Candidatus Udaeobacter sp.]
MKTYPLSNQNRFLTKVRYASAGAFMTAVALALYATLAAPSAYAEDHQFTIAYQITGIQLGVPDSERVTFMVLGTGHSPLLRNFTATGTVVTPLPQHACDDIYADITITTANGTIQIHEEDLTCYTLGTGIWWVTGGTLGASGCGTDRGTGATRSVHGRLVADYAGCLSLQGACPDCP